MASELGQASLYLTKLDTTFDNIIKENSLPNGAIDHTFKHGIASIKFIYFKTSSTRENPTWLDFINENLPADARISFKDISQRANGIVLIEISQRIFVLTFGLSAFSAIEKSLLHHDFGIISAMNMCGNDEIRQTRSRTHSITTQYIDRQMSKPSDSFYFGMSDHEILSYISAHIPENKKISIQGRDCLTIKIIGDKKISWETLIENCEQSLKYYEMKDYKDLFPNYPNLQEVSKEKKQELDEYLVNAIISGETEKMHMSVPEIIRDDEYSFSYTNDPRNNKNTIHSFLDITQLYDGKSLNIKKLNSKNIKTKNIYAYSHKEEKILPYRKWSLYNCIVFEMEIDNEYFLLSSGVWQKVDSDFHESIDNFIKNELNEKSLDQKYTNFPINNDEAMENREEYFNEKYCNTNKNSIKFDKAQLKIGSSKKNKEFCDILEIDGNIKITHVKKHGSAQSVIHLFSQARFYCESFLSDQTFLDGIRNHIENSNHQMKDKFLVTIQDHISKIFGNDYSVRLWLLYNKNLKKPEKEKLPLMAKYELKLLHDHLKNVCKYKEIELSMVPVGIVSYKKAVKGTKRAAKAK